MNVAVLGPPGCGKGTQAKLLAAHFGLRHFSLGETLRMEVSKGTELGQKTAAYVREGKLVPETIVLEVFKAFVHRNEKRGLILDGYPRTLAQAASLDAILRLSSVVLFEISEKAVLSRVSGRVIDSQGRSYNLNSNPPPEGVQYQRRHDDQPEVVRKRFREHCREIEPIASRYRDQGILLTVDAAGSIGAVLDQLLETLGEVSPAANG